jgi:hypothetical protein
MGKLRRRIEGLRIGVESRGEGELEVMDLLMIPLRSTNALVVSFGQEDKPL